MTIIWTQAARKHRIGRAHALHVIQTGVITEIVTKKGARGFKYLGQDTRGIELEVIAAEVPDGLLVIHVMPTALRRNNG